MGLIRRNPRKTLIFGLYIGLTLITWFFAVLPHVTAILYAALTLVLIAVYHVDCAAVIGNYLYIRGKTERAAKVLKYAVWHDTKSPAAYLRYSVYLMRGGMARDAAPLLDKAMGLKPKPMMLKNITLTKGSCLWLMGETDAAVEHLERMREVYDYVNAQVLGTLGYLYLLKGDTAKAEELSRAAVEETPSAAAAWDNLGQIYLKRNDLPKAKEMFETAVSHKPDLPDSLYFLGLIAKREGEAEKAKEFFKRALDCEITPLNTVERETIEREMGA